MLRFLGLLNDSTVYLRQVNHMNPVARAVGLGDRIQFLDRDGIYQGPYAPQLEVIADTGGVAAGDIVAVTGYDATTGFNKVDKADANESATAYRDLYYAPAAIAAAAAGYVTKDYVVVDSGLNGTIGDPVYLSATPGEMTLTAPTVGNIIEVGTVITTEASAEVHVDLSGAEREVDIHDWPNTLAVSPDAADLMLIADESATEDPTLSVTAELLLGTLHSVTAGGAVPDIADLLLTTDESVANDPPKATTVAELLSAAGDTTDLAAAPAADDRLLLTDESVAGDPAKSMTVQNLFDGIANLTAFTGAIVKDTDQVFFDDAGTVKSATYQVLMDGVNDLASFTGAVVPATDTVLIDDGGTAKSSTYQVFMNALSDLTALGAAPATTDEVALIDDPAGTPVTKTLTMQNLFNGIVNLTALGAAPATTDEVGLIDDPAGTPIAKTLTMQNMFNGIVNLTNLGAAPALSDEVAMVDDPAGTPIAKTLTVQFLLDAASSLAADTVADGDFFMLLEAGGVAKKEAIHDLATLFAGTGLAVASSVLSVDLNELTTEATFAPAADFIGIVDATDSGSDKMLWSTIATAIAGNGIGVSGGVLEMTTSELTAAVLDPTADSLTFIDADDSNASKKQTADGMVTALAGDGLQNDTSQFAVDASDFAGDGLSDDGSENLELDVNGLGTASTDPLAVDDKIATSDTSDSDDTKSVTGQVFFNGLVNLTNLGASPATTDEVAMVDDPAGTPIAKTLTMQNLFNGVVNLTNLGASPIATDELALIDDPAGTPIAKTMTVQNLFDGIAGLGAFTGPIVEATDQVFIDDAGTVKRATYQEFMDGVNDLTAFTGSVVPGTDTVLIDDGGTAKSATYQVFMNALSDLTALGAAPATTDEVALIDDPGGTPIAKTLTMQNMFNGIVNLTNLGAAPALTDELAMIDDPAGTPIAKTLTVQFLLDAANSLAAGAVADGDSLLLIKGGVATKEAVADLATLLGGTGLTATNSVLAVAGLTNSEIDAAAAIVRSKLAQETIEVVIPLEDLRVEDEWKDHLPDAPEGDGLTLGLADAVASVVTGTSTNNTSATEHCAFRFTLPENYVDEGDLTVRIRHKFDVVRDSESLLDVVAKRLTEDGALDATDLNLTAGIDCKATTSYTDRDYTIDGDASGDELASGETLWIAISHEADDGAGGSGAGVGTISKVSVLLPVKG